MKSWLFTLLLLLAILTSCKHNPSLTGIRPLDTSCTGPVPSFKADIQPIFRASCAKAGCHDGNSMPHNFALYSELKPVLDDSEVYYYVIADRKMPEDQPLDSADFRLIRCWLINGHPDN